MLLSSFLEGCGSRRTKLPGLVESIHEAAREPLEEGTRVEDLAIAREVDETFEVPPELEAELQESIAEADRGETISADELIERLRRIA
jgi:hypothetical protein